MLLLMVVCSHLLNVPRWSKKQDNKETLNTTDTTDTYRRRKPKSRREKDGAHGNKQNDGKPTLTGLPSLQCPAHTRPSRQVYSPCSDRHCGRTTPANMKGGKGRKKRAWREEQMRRNDNEVSGRGGG